MPPFPKPDSDFDHDTDVEIEALRNHKRLREVPERVDGRLLLATWNIANLGVQERREKDHRLIAEVISWFDIVAVQEVNDDLAGLYALLDLLPGYRILVSDTAGNDERAAFLYDPEKVELRELVGRLSVPPADFRHVRLEGVEGEFRGFDRSPYLAAFRAGSFTFLLVNVHLFFGSEDPDDVARRTLETYAVARWADLRRKSDNAYTKDIVALGDFNLPRVEESDPIYDALTSRGLVIPPHLSKIGGSSITGGKDYDQIAIFPGETSELRDRIDTFDFDNALFREFWDADDPQPFYAYTRYYISDHRPLWAEFRL